MAAACGVDAQAIIVIQSPCMKYLQMTAAALLALSAAACSAPRHEGATPADIIPLPASYELADGAWTPGRDVTLSITGLDTADSLSIARRVNALLGYEAAGAAPGEAGISLACTGADAASEAYEMTIDPRRVTAEAPSATGLFYSVVTLGELLTAGDGSAQCATITDSPRFAYRGMMLDVSRHFRDTAFIRKQIDAMARLKLNTLHLHLTDAAGWRMEIKKYPRLTDFAAWRQGETWKEWNASGNKYLDKDAPGASGGYYTQQELRELVEYAAANHITIIPEIEMPSHSEEVTAAYPELSCTHIQYGQPDFCPGNEATFTFIENVLEEVMDVFPSKLIHIGGDEAPKTAWTTCALCARRMREEKIAGVDGLQSYLIHRVERYLNDHGRDMLGWDEIMEGGLAPNATVMSWRGTEGGERAAALGHRVIMTPGRYCYLDGYQDAPATQPEAIGGYLPLELVYSYNPVEGMPDSAATFVYGLQGNLFTEYVPTASHAEYMLYPRMYAIAERGWSPAGATDYPAFRRRASALAADMRSHGYTTFDIDAEVGNRPGTDSTDTHLAYGAGVDYALPAWRNYPANGDSTLTDGIHGGWNYNDGRWQAFIGRGGTERVDVVIDLGEEKDITYVGADFMQICGPDVWMPARVVISAGDTRDSLAELVAIDNKVERDSLVSFKNFAWEGNARARYIRYVAVADSVARGVLFTDEIVVR